MTLLSGTRAAQPAAGAVSVGQLYRVTDEAGILERSTGTEWVRQAPVDLAFGNEWGQIRFPAVQNPSSDPHTYDDYEEGEFTPFLTGNAGGSGQVHTLQYGRYAKRGGWVDCYLEVDWSTRGTLTGAAVIGGLPFACLTTSPLEYPSAACGYFAGFDAASAVASIQGFVEGGTTLLYIGIVLAAGGVAQTACVQAHLSAPGGFLFSVGYPTTD